MLRTLVNLPIVEPRVFTFSNTFDGKFLTKKRLDADTPGTTLVFSDFVGTKLRSYDDIKPAALKERLLEHFLPFFHDRKGADKAFRVSIALNTLSANPQKDLFSDVQSITPDDVPQLEIKTIESRIDFFAEISMNYLLRKSAEGRLFGARSRPLLRIDSTCR